MRPYEAWTQSNTLHLLFISRQTNLKVRSRGFLLLSSPHIINFLKEMIIPAVQGTLGLFQSAQKDGYAYWILN